MCCTPSAIKHHSTWYSCFLHINMVGGIANLKTRKSDSQESGMEMRTHEVNEYQEDELLLYTLDGSVNYKGRPALKDKSGGWMAGSIILVNQGLATLAFFGVNVNLVLFLTRVLQQDNADASNNVSKWTGTVYIFSLIGAFLSDSYWGRFKTCAIFQAIFVLGLVLLSFVSQMMLIKPTGCGDEQRPCSAHSKLQLGLFYLSIYMVALGNGGYQPNIATFGADQFDEEDPVESHSKISFFSYFYLALNTGSLFSNTFLSYFEDHGMWTMGFAASAISAMFALLLFLIGTPAYRHFKPGGNPISRVCQVAVAASRKWRVKVPPSGDGLCESVRYKLPEEANDATSSRGKILHSEGFKFLDRAAIMNSEDLASQAQSIPRDPWRLCTVTQVEEVKCVLRLLPIWLCTIPYSVIFTQMSSLFVVQGAAMETTLGRFSISPSSMSAFDILSVTVVIFLCRRVLHPIACRIKKSPRGITELQRMGVGLVIAVISMVVSGTVEHFRLKQALAAPPCGRCHGKPSGSPLHIMWQVPQYVLVGASEVFMYVGQLEFFNGQAPDGLKSFGSALCMTSMALGNFFSDLIVTAVMKVTAKGNRPGWIPDNLNDGHLDRFYFLLAAMASLDFVLYVICAKWYKCTKYEGRAEVEISSV